MYWRFGEKVKFIKIIPTQYNQLVLGEMKKQNMKIIEGANGWFKIESQELQDKAMQELVEEKTAKVMEDGGYEDECDMIADGFRKSGFIVTIREIKE
jgi:hypothetical protein